MILASLVTCYGLFALLLITEGTAPSSHFHKPVVIGVTLVLIFWVTFVLILEKKVLNPRGIPDISTVEMLNLGVGAISGLTGQVFFAATARNLAEMLGMDFAYIGELSDDRRTVQTIAVYSGNREADNFSYAIQGTPCEKVDGKNLCLYSRGVKDLFPSDRLLMQMGIESFVGVPLLDSLGNPLGVMVALGRTPLAKSKRAELICNIFSGRASAELERVKAEKELSAEKDFADAVFTYTAGGIMVLDMEGRVLKINPAGARIFRKEPVAIAGAKITDLFPDAGDMLLIKDDQTREVAISLSPGVSVPIGFSSSKLLGSSNTEQGIIVSFKDLSEAKRLQAESRRKEDLHAMGKVISGVAHEVRNPLFGISSIGQILEREITTPQHQELIRALLKETSRMKHLIDEFLIYARPSRLELAEIDLRAMLDEVKNQLLSKSEGKQVLIQVPSPFLIRADRGKTALVLLNILENALDAARSAVIISAISSQGTQTIVFSDDGRGIRPQDLEKIFDPFFSTKKGGTGLGLPVCRKLIEEHGGTLDVRTVPEKGTEVIIILKG